MCGSCNPEYKLILNPWDLSLYKSKLFLGRLPVMMVSGPHKRAKHLPWAFFMISLASYFNKTNYFQVCININHENDKRTLQHDHSTPTADKDFPWLFNHTNVKLYSSYSKWLLEVLSESLYSVTIKIQMLIMFQENLPILTPYNETFVE